MVSFMPQLLYHWIGGWAGSRVGQNTVAKKKYPIILMKEETVTLIIVSWALNYNFV
jgi:hypothetical protein